MKSQSSSHALRQFKAGEISGVMETRAGKKLWIQEAIKKPGALRKSLKTKKGKKIPVKKLAKAAKKGGKLGKRARLAQTLKKLRKKK